MIKISDPYLPDQMPQSYRNFSIETKKSEISLLLVLMLWVVFENSEFFFSMICYIGSGTSQTNDSKKENYDQALIHLVPASLVLQTTICVQVFLDVSSLYAHYIAFLPQMHALLDVLISLVRHSFWEPVFSQFLEPKFWPKQTKMVLRHSYEQKKMLLLGFNKKICVPNMKCSVEKNLE